MARPIAVLDANVLYSETLGDVFLALVTASLIEVRWSATLQHEWQSNLARKRRDVDAAWIAARAAHLDHCVPDASVPADDVADAILNLPDANDRHVLGSAIRAGAGFIVTANLGDFPVRCLAPHRIVALTADAMLRRLFEAEPLTTRAALERLAASNDALDERAFRERLRRAGLARSVKQLWPHVS